jgi:DNA primase
LFAAGLRKSRLLYGLPEALQAPGPVVICEGPTDVWRFGTNAVALFGKSVSSEQQRLILHHFAGRPIVIALDADAREEAEEMRARLETARGFGPGDNRVVLLELPVGASDPAASTREVLNNRLTQSLEIQEISK